jgi:hypothetical protein
MSKAKEIKEQKAKESKGRLKTQIVASSKKRSFTVPLSIYEKAMEEVCSPDVNISDRKCHLTRYSSLNSTNVWPVCRAHLMEAAKQALEDRNYKILYEIISKSFQLKDPFLFQQMQEVNI